MKLFIIICVTLLPLTLTAPSNTYDPSQREIEIRVLKNSELSIENVKKYLYLLEIQHPDKVLAQYVLETGWGKSYVCRKYNNLFGFMKFSKEHNKYVYFKYYHWTESIEAYKRFQTKKYKGGNYYAFLDRIGYAEDSTYTQKLKQFKFKV